MSSVNRNKIRKLILKEFKMLGMQPMQSMGKIGAFSQNSQGCDACGMSPCGCDEYNDMGEDALMPQHSMQQPMDHSQKGNVSREDCCAAIMCLVECCECPVTKQAILECCQSLLSGNHGYYSNHDGY